MKKAIRKTKKVEVKQIKNEKTELQKLTLTFCAIIGVFLVFYVIADYKVKNKEKDNNSDIAEVIQYEKILISTLLTQKSSEYYVMSYIKEDDYKNLYMSYINAYAGVEKALPFYSADLNDTFNLMYKSEISRLKVTNILELKISHDTLFKVKDGRILESFETEETILRQLKSLIAK